MPVRTLSLHELVAKSGLSAEAVQESISKSTRLRPSLSESNQLRQVSRSSLDASGHAICASEMVALIEEARRHTPKLHLQYLPVSLACESIQEVELKDSVLKSLLVCPFPHRIFLLLPNRSDPSEGQ